MFFLNGLEQFVAEENTPLSGSQGGNPNSKYSRRSSVKKNELRVLFPTAAALGGIYITNKMRSRIRPASYQDLYDYTICEGPKREYVDRVGEYRTFSHFLCPESPNQMFKRYCCRDAITNEGICCAYDELRGLSYGISKWAILGGCLAILGVFVMLSLVVYCCCFAKRRRNQKNSPPQKGTDEPVKRVENQNAPQPIGFLSYPMGPSAVPSTVPMYGPSVPYSIPVQPGAPWIAPMPGSSWHHQVPYQEHPPPPYSGPEPIDGAKPNRS